MIDRINEKKYRSEPALKTGEVPFHFTGAIFDLDGTLLDSMHVWDTIGSEYLISKGITPESGLNQIFKKMSIVQAAEYYKEHYNITDSIEDTINGVNHMIEGIYANDLFCKAGVKELLRVMKKQGIKMCVATATDRYMVEAALKNNGIADYFSEILTCTEVGFGKDTPEIFEKALTVLGTTKETTAVFEDSLHAIETAKDAGFYVIGIEDRYSALDREQIKDLCDDYITSYQDWGNRNL